MSQLPLLNSLSDDEMMSDSQSIAQENIIPNSNQDAMSVTIGRYLMFLEEDSKNNIYYIFSLCGGLHLPSNISGYECIRIWRIVLYAYIVLFVLSVLVVIYYQLNLHRQSDVLVFAFSMILQTFLVYPLLSNTSKRVSIPITAHQMEALPGTVRICQYYLLITVTLSIFYYIFTVFSAIFHQEDFYKDHYTSFIIVVAVNSWSPLAVSLLSMWGLFFIILDTKEIVLDLIHLKELAKNDQLTSELYDHLHEKHMTINLKTLELCDAIAIVAYISILSCIVLCFIYISNFSGFTIGYVLITIAAQFREAFLLLFALPCIADSSEMFDAFSSYMSKLQWGQSVMEDGSTLAFNTERSVLLENNLMYMRIWAATVDRPLVVHILGRKIKKREMRAQLVAIFVVGLGSLASFAIGGIFRSV